MDVVLQTQVGDPALALRDITRYEDGSGFVCRLCVNSRGFILDRLFWFDEAGLVDFLSALESMERTLGGHAELATRFEDDFIRLELDARGHLAVTGESREHSELDQHLRFGFSTDQTVLRPFARDLRTATSSGR